MGEKVLRDSLEQTLKSAIKGERGVIVQNALENPNVKCAGEVLAEEMKSYLQRRSP